MKITLSKFIFFLLICFLALSLYEYSTARTQLSGSGPTAIPKISLSAPDRFSPSKPFEITWKIQTPTPRHIDQTTIYYDTVSSPSALTVQDSPQAVGYRYSLPDYQQGDFDSPGIFFGKITPPATATKIFLRAYALIDGNHYWTPEITLNRNEKN